MSAHARALPPRSSVRPMVGPAVPSIEALARLGARLATVVTRSTRPGVIAALVAVVFGLGAVLAVAPQAANATSSWVTRCDGVNLRTKASTSSTRVITLPAGAKVVTVGSVTGGSWKTVCNGRTATGRTWLKIVSVNGKSASTRYGVPVVYAATSLFKWHSTWYSLETACSGVYLRTGASVKNTAKVRLSAGVPVTATTKVSGGSWTAGCTSTTTGTTWYKITSINGRSVSSLYGVSAVYGASSLFRTRTLLQETVASPTPTPTPKPTPTPAPSSSPGTSPSPTPTPAPSIVVSDYVEGIDVSHWQGAIDWKAVKASGRSFTFLKASESTDYIDPTYADNRAEAHTVGLLVGAYHFARPSTTSGDAVAEADHFVDSATPASGELLPVLDLEVTGGLGTSALQTWVKTFLDRVYARTGVRGMIYTSPSFWSNYMGNTQSLATGGYKMLWVAHWTTASSPTVPANNWAGNGWTFWQYTSSGTVAGISGRVDLDRYRRTDFTPVLIP